MELLSSNLCNSSSINEITCTFSTYASMMLVRQLPAPSAALATMQMVV